MENRKKKIKPVDKKLSLSELKKVFEEAGLRLTHQRIMIYEAICHAKDHPSAEAVYERLRKEAPTISLDTVYRTLSTFERLGLIKKVQIFDHIRFDPDISRHHHFICTVCKKIVDFSWPEFDKFPLPEHLQDLGRVLDHQVEIRGVCKECQEGMKGTET